MNNFAKTVMLAALVAAPLSPAHALTTAAIIESNGFFGWVATLFGM